MSEFSYNFGNYPPGVFEDDPSAPWNEEDQARPVELIDEIFDLLREAGHEPEYDEMRIKCWGLYVDVKEK